MIVSFLLHDQDLVNRQWCFRRIWLKGRQEQTIEDNEWWRRILLKGSFVEGRFGYRILLKSLKGPTLYKVSYSFLNFLYQFKENSGIVNHHEFYILFMENYKSVTHIIEGYKEENVRRLNRYL